MSAPWKKYIPKKVTRKRKPSKRFKVKTKTSFRQENLAEPFDYLAAFEDCHGDKAAMAKILYNHRTYGERTLARTLRRLCVDHIEQHVLYGWIVDFFLPRLNCVVEVDGSFHLIPERAAQDRERDAVLRSKGLRVLRYDTSVCESRPRWVAEDIAKRLASPPPDFSTLAAAARPTRSVSRTPETQAAVTPRMEIPHAEKLPWETGS